jgi:hypothetical protein
MNLIQMLSIKVNILLFVFLNNCFSEFFCGISDFQNVSNTFDDDDDDDYNDLKSDDEYLFVLFIYLINLIQLRYK